VVQIISCSKLFDGRSESYTVTLADAAQAREVRKLFLREEGIRIEEIRGQLVYRPTKISKLADK